MKFNFTEIKKIEFDIDFQKIYDFIEKEYENDPNYNLDPWDIHTEFGDNMNYYLKKIYNYDIKDINDNEPTSDIRYNDCVNWIPKNKIDE